MGARAGHTESVCFDDADETAPALALVGREFGNYRLIQLLGEGGMGWIYLAHHLRIGRRVAIKMLRPELATDPVAVRRFFAEARAVNRIRNDHIVEIHDFVHNEHGFTYLVLEYLEGHDLLTLMEGESGLPLSRAVDIMIQVASALAAAHDAGVVHRDLKPENIFLTPGPEGGDYAKLLDFGIAKLLGAGSSSTRLTRAGTSVGTPSYISPEQALGAEVDHRADIYSFGLILYELATGRRPFASADVLETVAKQVTETPPRPRDLEGSRDLPPALDDLIMQCMAKRAAERPQEMEEVGLRLRAIRDQLERPAAAVEVVLPPEPSLRQVTFESVQLPPLPVLPPRGIALGAAAAVAIGLGGLAFGPVLDRSQPTAHAASAPDGEPVDPPDPAPLPRAAPRRLIGPPLAAAPRPRRKKATRPPLVLPPAAARRSEARPAGRYDVIPVYRP